MSWIRPIVHLKCCKGQKCIHVYVPKKFDAHSFGSRCCLPTDGETFSAKDFQAITGYSSLLRNRVPREDRKIGTRQMVPILSQTVNKHNGIEDKRIAISSFRDMLQNISEKWLLENSEPEEWEGGQDAIDKWRSAHFKYLIENPVDLNTLSRKLFYDNFNRYKEKGKKKKEKRNGKYKEKCVIEEKYDAHYPYADDVEIQKSFIPGAGLGVFAKVPFNCGRIIGRYVGKIISLSELTKMNKKDSNKIISIILPSGREVLINGGGVDHFSAFFNHKWQMDRNPLGAANLMVSAEGYFICMRNITAGEELYFNYGIDYWAWQLFGIDIDEIKDTAKRIEVMNKVYKSLPNNIDEKEEKEEENKDKDQQKEKIKMKEKEKEKEKIKNKKEEKNVETEKVESLII